MHFLRKLEPSAGETAGWFRERKTVRRGLGRSGGHIVGLHSEGNLVSHWVTRFPALYPHMLSYRQSQHTYTHTAQNRWKETTVGLLRETETYDTLSLSTASACKHMPRSTLEGSPICTHIPGLKPPGHSGASIERRTPQSSSNRAVLKS